jgi:hypothetical protein
MIKTRVVDPEPHESALFLGAGYVSAVEGIDGSGSVCVRTYDSDADPQPYL